MATNVTVLCVKTKQRIMMKKEPLLTDRRMWSRPSTRPILIEYLMLMLILNLILNLMLNMNLIHNLMLMLMLMLVLIEMIVTMCRKITLRKCGSFGSPAAPTVALLSLLAPEISSHIFDSLLLKLFPKYLMFAPEILFTFGMPSPWIISWISL